MPIPVGTAVTIKYTTLTGTTSGAVVNDDGDYLVKVTYTDQFGSDQQRYFREEELEV